jgi:hypothetical protein
MSLTACIYLIYAAPPMIRKSDNDVENLVFTSEISGSRSLFYDSGVPNNENCPFARLDALMKEIVSLDGCGDSSDPSGCVIDVGIADVSGLSKKSHAEIDDVFSTYQEELADDIENLSVGTNADIDAIFSDPEQVASILDEVRVGSNEGIDAVFSDPKNLMREIDHAISNDGSVGEKAELGSADDKRQFFAYQPDPVVRRREESRSFGSGKLSFHSIEELPRR